ncbi:hypothetical protein CP532_1926 [Ophiocordyceps camponoti-leonardi (nom. inval.)]|nr:hypothetical protein CP532_1926 [Ophiocordyceps camponoti-leonardi (nom. inval.)]
MSTLHLQPVDNNIRGRLALVTGSTGGIGAACARALAAEGCDVALHYHSSVDKAEALAAELRGRHPDQVFVIARADLSSREETRSLVGSVLGQDRVRQKAVSILVANAGSGRRIRDVADVGEDDWDAMLEVNSRSQFVVTKACVEGMRAQSWGRVILVGSIASRGGGINGCHYAASKGALTSMGLNLATVLAPEGITVNIVQPAMIGATGMMPTPKSSSWEKTDDMEELRRRDAGLAIAASVPVRRLGAPEEVAGVVCMFARTGYATDWTQASSLATKLVQRMTTEEKANITRGFAVKSNVCAGNSGSVPRLGWPGLCLHDAANGVRATDMVSAYPAAIHVGASWDRALTYRRALFMGREFRGKGVNVVLGPNAGPLGRTPLGGRLWESFSVDPYLSGQLISETITGFRRAGVIASLKHLIANEQETFRRSYAGVAAVSSNVDDRTLHEYYLWPFVDGVRAGAGSVMCGYNRLNSTYACQHSQLLNHILKGDMAFSGFVLLDWNAQHDLGSVDAGLDMVMPLAGAWGDNLTSAVLDGTISEARLDDMATRIISAWYLVGQDAADFPPPGIGMKNLTEPHPAVDVREPGSRPVLLEGAEAGHVLVKNLHGALPLTPRPAMLSVFGYDAAVPPSKNVDAVFQLGYTSSPAMAQAVLGSDQHFDQAARQGTIMVGGRAGANAPPYISDPLGAIQQRAAADGTWVNWDLGSAEPEVNGASEACLVFINAMATEAWDREGLRDEASDGMVRHVAAQCANTIVVVHAAGPRLVEGWIDHVNVTAAIVAHLPGQDSGTALVRLLYGDANFSGRLPYTLARDEADYPVYAPCGRGDNSTTDPQCDFTEGVYLDYRAFDARGLAPRFEFGFGLSYTSFSYSALRSAIRLETDDDNNEDDDDDEKERMWEEAAVVSARIANVGPVAGAEVAQLYVGIPGGPPRQLRGFEKVLLRSGEEAEVRFSLTRRDLSAWDVVRQRWALKKGLYPLYVGASSRDIRLKGSLVVGGK